MTKRRAKSLALWLSKSHCIFQNLAFEDLLYRKTDFTDQDNVLIWRSDPVVVIGRHQNPWREANLKYLRENGIKLARRNSGGGTVFHDLGNVNFSVLTSKSRHDRLENMKLIADVLKNLWNVETKISQRNDLRLLGTDSKISGTAAKLGSKASYHHFTLMVSVDLIQMKQALRPSLVKRLMLH